MGQQRTNIKTKSIWVKKVNPYAFFDLLMYEILTAKDSYLILKLVGVFPVCFFITVLRYF